MNSEEFCHKTAYYIKNDIPFFFLVDFEKETPIAIPISDCKSEDIKFCFSNTRSLDLNEDIPVEAHPYSFDTYEKSFNIVKESIHHGDSFLVNLTYPTPVSIDNKLETIYQHSKALYKLKYKDQFVVFSPESFIQIRDHQISTFPMKGTIMADIPGAKERLLNNKKEQWEHNTIVDLMRNDLSMVATDVEVKRFRFISEIFTHKGKMLQTSSEVSGKLNDHWEDSFGQMLLSMLPAGSISGAPKDKTIKIIQEAELDRRGFYSGIFGTYDNGNVDSAIAIRYIEQDKNGNYTYRSGGGITFMSDVKEEYQELINKIYIPTR